MRSVIKIRMLTGLACTMLFQACAAQQRTTAATDTLVEAREWLKDDDGKVRYKEWRGYPSTTVERLQGFIPSPASYCTLGGLASMQFDATGFFHARRTNGRWWVIDPHGHPVIINAVNSIRVGKSATAEETMTRLFGGKSGWCSATIDSLRAMGFNSAGSWSDTASILQYNRSYPNPFPYTTQLNLLSGYASAMRKADRTRSKRSLLACILDEDFVGYCEQQMQRISYLNADPNLLGHFSDNELPFTSKELDILLQQTEPTDKGLQACLNWMQAKNVDSKNITPELREELLGWLAARYFETVGRALKKYDPRHMYLGSRFHGSVKNNRHIVAAAGTYADIVSVNYYGKWEVAEEQMVRWTEWSGKPFFITEFYTKGEDTGMPNSSGAGWIVRTQADRGVHYQNFCLRLLALKNCVGWHWFRYQDNDAGDASADDSNKDSNKGLTDIRYAFYQALVQSMRNLNNNKYALVEFFDKRK